MFSRYATAITTQTKNNVRITKRGISTRKRGFAAAMALFFVAIQLLSPISVLSAGQSATAYAAEQSDDVQANASPRASLQAAGPVANPALGQSCGLDIALVLDNSTSISSGELATMKSAMTSFTSAFAGTPTQFSVTHFATTASVLQGFTANTATVNTAINSISAGGGYTNWQDGLVKARGTFDPRPSVPNMVIFASDGNPNRIDNGTSATEADALGSAVTVANSLKQAPYNAHIMAMGIGNDLDVANLQAISGAGDVVTSDFSTLAADLAALASKLCGGTITATKLIDQDGNLNTTNDRTPASGWTFDVNGSPSDPVATVTDSFGQTPAVKVDPGTYSVNETAQAGYQLLSASCSGASNNGTSANNSVNGVVVASGSIVSCTFINSPTPTLTLVKNVVNDNGGSKTVSDFAVKLDGGTVAWSTAISASVGAHTASEVNLPGYAAGSWTGDCAADGSVTLSLGQNATCYITNDDIAPTLTVTKKVINPFGDPLAITAFPLFVDQTQVTSGVASTQFNKGTHTISETQQTGYVLSGFTGDCEYNDDDILVVALDLSASASCTLTNTAVQPKLVVKKHVINDNGGTKSASDFTMTVSSNSIIVPNFAGDEAGTTIGLNEGSFNVSEVTDDGYAKTLSGDCSGTISVGQTKTCTITNDDIAPTLTLHKHVINDNGGTAVPSDWTLYAIPEVPGPVLGGTGEHGFENKEAQAHMDYSLLESGPLGYSADKWECYSTAGVFSHPDGASDKIRMSEGANVVCDITNNDDPVPGIAVVKSGPATAHAGDTVTYTFTVTNTGNAPIAGLTVVDSITGNGVYVSGDANNNNQLDLDETWVYAADYTIPADQTEPVVNTVSVCGSEAEPEQEIPLFVETGSLLAVNVERGDICAEDSHTLTIDPPVVVVTPPSVVVPQETKLANSGVTQTGSATIIALLNVVLAVGTFAVARRRFAHATK